MRRQRVTADQEILDAMRIERLKQEPQVIESGGTAILGHLIRVAARAAIPLANQKSQ